jgi:hypothetical protein
MNFTTTFEFKSGFKTKKEKNIKEKEKEKPAGPLHLIRPTMTFLPAWPSSSRSLCHAGSTGRMGSFRRALALVHYTSGPTCQAHPLPQQSARCPGFPSPVNHGVIPARTPHQARFLHGSRQSPSPCSARAPRWTLIVRGNVSAELVRL